MERDVSATRGNPSSEDEVPTSVSRGAKQTNENLLCEGERPPVRYTQCRALLYCAKSQVIAVTLACCGQEFLFYHAKPRAGSGGVRIDQLRFLAGCRTRQLNQALSVLSLSLGFFDVCVVLLTRDSF